MIAGATLEKRLAQLERQGAGFGLTTGCACVATVGLADIATGAEVAFGLFYLIPIALVAWYAGRHLGLTISLLSSVAWFMADELGGRVYSRPIIRYWNAVVRLGFFVVVTLLIPALKALEREKEISRIDALTGAANRRHLFELLQSELDRSQRYRHSFTVAYLDVDNFKTVNDELGHLAGDRLLCAVVHRANVLREKERQERHRVRRPRHRTGGGQRVNDRS